MLPASYEILFASFAFILGTAIGSFLNVCIYRLPLGLSVNEPRRSFCPSCKYQIPWYRNLPLVSWLSLRGKCANCGAPISIRYLGVELLTGLLFLAVWWRVWIHPRPEWLDQGWLLALPYWIFVSLLIVATFIDFEHFIIPDVITWGGVAAGVVLSFAIPPLMAERENLLSGAWSLAGATTGYLLLWGVVEAGKLAFGKKAFALTGPTPFTWTRREVPPEEGGGSDADLVVGDVSWKSAPRPSIGATIARHFGRFVEALTFRTKPGPLRGEAWVWSELFYREGDRLTLDATRVEIDGERLVDVRLTFHHERLKVGGRTWTLERVTVIRGEARALIIPREAMGFGDVKFIAAIGAFLGWKAVGFTIMSASTIGAVVGLLSIGLGRREFSAKIPFGPYLALGAILWVFTGPEWVHWYLNAVTPPAAP